MALLHRCNAQQGVVSARWHEARVTHPMLFSSHWKGQSPPSVPVLISLTNHTGEKITVDARKIVDFKTLAPGDGADYSGTVLYLGDESVSVRHTPLQIQELVDAEIDLHSTLAVVAEVELPAGWIILNRPDGKVSYIKVSSIYGVDPVAAGTEPTEGRCTILYGLSESVRVNESIDEILTHLRSEVPLENS